MNRKKEYAMEFLADIRSPEIKMTREGAANMYAYLIALTYLHADHEVSEINLAIKERWSLSGLKWIKNRAWKIYESSSQVATGIP